MYVQVLGGSCGAIAKMRTEYLESHRWLLDQGFVIVCGWVVGCVGDCMCLGDGGGWLRVCL